MPREPTKATGLSRQTIMLHVIIKAGLARFPLVPPPPSRCNCALLTTAEWSLSQTAASFIRRNMADGTSGHQNYSRTRIVRQRIMTAPSPPESDSNQKWFLYGFVSFNVLIRIVSFDLIALHGAPFPKKSDNCPFRSAVNKRFGSDLNITVYLTASDYIYINSWFYYILIVYDFYGNFTEKTIHY